MSYPIGTLKNGNLYIRCPQCLDTPKREHIGHMSIQVETGVFYCFRCGAKGKLHTRDYIDLLNTYNLECSTSLVCDTLSDERDYTSSLYRDSRYSLLERHTDSQGTVTVAMRDLQGKVIGYQHRTKDKRISTEGKRGYGYIGSSLVALNTIRIVEGIYDVVYDTDVCVFGSLSYGMVQRLKAYRLLLAPDSDIVRESSKLRSFVKMVDILLARGYNIEGIEVFPKGDDPGSIYPDRGTIYTAKEFIKIARVKLK